MKRTSFHSRRKRKREGDVVIVPALVTDIIPLIIITLSREPFMWCKLRRVCRLFLSIMMERGTPDFAGTLALCSAARRGSAFSARFLLESTVTKTRLDSGDVLHFCEGWTTWVNPDLARIALDFGDIPELSALHYLHPYHSTYASVPLSLIDSMLVVFLHFNGKTPKEKSSITMSRWSRLIVDGMLVAYYHKELVVLTPLKDIFNSPAFTDDWWDALYAYICESECDGIWKDRSKFEAIILLITGANPDRWKKFRHDLYEREQLRDSGPKERPCIFY